MTSVLRRHEHVYHLKSTHDPVVFKNMIQNHIATATGNTLEMKKITRKTSG